MIINNNPINYVPALANNPNNRNEMVTDTNQDRWFIDHTGKAICLTKISGDFENTSHTSGIVQRTPANVKRVTKTNDSGNLITENK